jgi:hypothetical protein
VVVVVTEVAEVEVDLLGGVTVGCEEWSLEQAASATLARVPPVIPRNLRRPKACDPFAGSPDSGNPDSGSPDLGGPEIGGGAISLHATGDLPFGSCIDRTRTAVTEVLSPYGLRTNAKASSRPIIRPLS